MNENIDLTKILKNCPKGWKFYSTIYGEVEFDKIKKESEYPIVIITKHGNNSDIKSDGRYYGEYDDGECTLFPSKEQRDWSKFTAPWYKKLTEPKFHVGQYITDGHIGGQITGGKITRIGGNYTCYKILDFNEGTSITIPIKLQNNYHLWTIQDAKDGDILAFSNDTIVIFKDLYNSTSFHSYCHIEDGIFDFNKDELPDWWNSEGFKPATKEQRDFLFRKIKEAGYKWNAETKILEKLVKPKFDPKTLKPFDKVIVRDSSNRRWRCAFFSHVRKEDENYTFKYVTTACTYEFCIPYNEDTACLVGTKDEAPEYYRYWEN